MKKTYFASCPKRSEEYLYEELKELGAGQLEKKGGGVQFKAEDQLALKILFETRLSSRIFRLLDVYPIRNEKDLYEKVTKKWWHKVFDNNQTFKIQTLFDRDASAFFKNSMHFSMKVKDAIVDQFRRDTGKRPSIDTEDPDISLLVRVESRGGRAAGFNVKLFLDMTNTPLSDRGYRRGRHRAPLRENLAAVLVHLSQWDSDKDSLIDIFCGSGTILIEATMKKLNLPPSYIKIKRAKRGRKCEFAFLNHSWFVADRKLQQWVADYFESVIARAEAVKNQKSLNIIGSDLDISVARENVKAAGLENHIQLLKADFKDFSPEVKTQGITLISNPPFGERLEGGEELYYQIGQGLLQNFKGADAFILVSDENFRKKIFLKPTQKYPLFNGPLDCRLIHYKL